MARKPAGGARRPRGRRASTGPRGESGELAADLGNILARITQELEDVHGILVVQFTRIVQLQGEVDRLRLAIEKTD